MKQKVLTIGGATQDIFLHYENPELLTLKNEVRDRTCLLFEQGSKIDVTNIKYYTGGGATNTATSFKLLSLDVTTVFKVGNDTQANFILNELKKDDLNFYNSICSDQPTAISFILPTPTDRIILAFRGANTDLKIEDIPLNLIENSDLVYITSLSGNAAKLLHPITELAKKNYVKVVVNPGIGQLKEKYIKDFISAIKNIDILILNTKEAEQLLISLLDLKKNYNFQVNQSKYNYGPELLNIFTKHNNQLLTIDDYFKIILNEGPSICVVTNGAEGVYVATNNQIFFHDSIKPQKITNTLGAGDAFGSCFIANLIKQRSIEDSLFAGIINASAVISQEGAKTGLLTTDELNKKEQELSEFKNVQKFTLI